MKWRSCHLNAILNENEAASTPVGSAGDEPGFGVGGSGGLSISAALAASRSAACPSGTVPRRSGTRTGRPAAPLARRGGPSGAMLLSWKTPAPLARGDVPAAWARSCGPTCSPRTRGRPATVPYARGWFSDDPGEAWTRTSGYVGELRSGASRVIDLGRARPNFPVAFASLRS